MRWASCLVPDFRGNVCCIFPFSKMSTIDWSYIVFMIYDLAISDLFIFLRFCQRSFLCLLDEHINCILDCIYVVYCVYLCVLNSLCIPRMKSDWLWYLFFVICYWNTLQVFYWGFHRRVSRSTGGQGFVLPCHPAAEWHELHRMSFGNG